MLQVYGLAERCCAQGTNCRQHSFTRILAQRTAIVEQESAASAKDAQHETAASAGGLPSPMLGHAVAHRLAGRSKKAQPGKLR
jgi:hypothetical protein